MIPEPHEMHESLRRGMEEVSAGQLTTRHVPVPDDGFCCLDDCCGPGSWCCAHANPHAHDEEAS